MGAGSVKKPAQGTAAPVLLISRAKPQGSRNCAKFTRPENRILHRSELVGKTPLQSLILDYLSLLATSTTKMEQEPNYEEQYQRLVGMTDPRSSLEREFLHVLKVNQIHLPDSAQNHPTSNKLVQADFYYERESRQGVCIFIDGPHHDNPEARNADKRTRKKLQDYGFRVITISHDRPIIDQLNEHPDIFVSVA